MALSERTPVASERTTIERTPVTSERTPVASERTTVERAPVASERTAAERAPLSVERTSGKSDAIERALAILTRYVSPPTARSILGLAERRVGATGVTDLRVLLDSIEHSLRLFVTDQAQVQRCRASLEELSDSLPKTTDAIVVPIESEEDIVKARMEARRIATQVGFTTVGVTRLMTAVSEVARNIVLYAGHGQIEVTPASAPRGIEIVARDRGPGIRNLDQILAGNYKSRLGMGLGLRGVKKIADRFEVQTAIGAGTTVRFSLRVV